MNTEQANDKLCEELRALLQAEIGQGNKVVEIRKGWPKEDSVLVLLEKPFKTATHEITKMKEIEYIAVDDPHWWKGEYRCNIHNHVLACRFD